MSQARIEMNATILPNGKVLATGGSLNDEDATTASLNADLYDPVDEHVRIRRRERYAAPVSLERAAASRRDRRSCSAAIPLAAAYESAHGDLLAGLPVQRGRNRGRAAAITAFPVRLAYGGTFQIQTPDAADIASVVLVRPGAPTHAFDMEQRLIELSFTAGSGRAERQRRRRTATSRRRATTCCSS